MVSRFTELIVDSHDPRRLAEFWCEVLGYHISDEAAGCVEIAGTEKTIDEAPARPVVPTIVFVPVPEGKTVKNRLHIDVNPIDRTQEEEVDRLIAAGARRADVGQGDVHWVVMADPEGNEFCVLRSLAPGA